MKATLPIILAVLFTATISVLTLGTLGIDLFPAIGFTAAMGVLEFIAASLAFKWTLHREARDFVKSVFIPERYCLCIGRCSCGREE